MERMRELVGKLNRYAYEYYVLDNPTIADGEYDALFDELVALEGQLGIVLPDSPTRKVGGDPIKSFEEHRHIHKLYSLDKVKTLDDLREWYKKQCAQLGYSPNLTIEHKLDGLTLCFTYENGQLLTAATRGNGEVGENVTAQALTIKSVPLSIEFKGRVEIQGEGVMRLSIFEKYNQTALEPLKNPRNGIAGAIRNLDPKVTATRKPDVYFYSINYIEGANLSSQREMFDFLRENGFLCSGYNYFEDIEGICRYIESFDKSKLDYLIDGLVIKIDDLASRDILGFTDRFPRWAVAFKFESEEATTRILDVIWQVGRTGKLTPLALLEPIELAGATIKRATLNNYGDIERKKVAIGSRVFIRRSNDVIPEILGAVDEQEYEYDNEAVGQNDAAEYGQNNEAPNLDDSAYNGQNSQKHIDNDESQAKNINTLTKILPPKQCPACGKELVVEGAHIFCVNNDCPPQRTARIEHFCSCMDIEGISQKTAHLLTTALGVHTPSQLYHLKLEDLLTLDGFKEKKATNILKAIEKSKGASLDSLIFALGIPNVGKKTASDLARVFISLEALSGASLETLVAIPEIGETVARGITLYFEQNRDIVPDLMRIGIRPRYERATGLIFEGKKVVLTGSLQKYLRSQATKIIESLGGFVSSTVTRDTAFVVAGEDAGSKLTKARTLGITVLSEEEFDKMIKEKA